MSLFCGIRWLLDFKLWNFLIWCINAYLHISAGQKERGRDSLNGSAKRGKGLKCSHWEVFSHHALILIQYLQEWICSNPAQLSVSSDSCIFSFLCVWGWLTCFLQLVLLQWSFKRTWKLQHPNEFQVFYYVFTKIVDCVLTVFSSIIFARWTIANNSLCHPICQTATTQQAARVNVLYLMMKKSVFHQCNAWIILINGINSIILTLDFPYFTQMIAACLWSMTGKDKHWQTPLFAVISTITAFSEQNAIESSSLWLTSVLHLHYRECNKEKSVIWIAGIMLSLKKENASNPTIFTPLHIKTCFGISCLLFIVVSQRASVLRDLDFPP